MTLIKCFDPTLGCLDTKIWWKYHPDSPWRIEAVAVVSFCVFDGSVFQVPTSPCSSQSKVFHSRAKWKKKTSSRDFLANSSHDVRSQIRSFLLPGTIAAKKDGGKEFLAPWQGDWVIGILRAYHSQHGSLETPMRFWGETFSEWSWGKLHLFGLSWIQNGGIFWICFFFSLSWFCSDDFFVYEKTSHERFHEKKTCLLWVRDSVRLRLIGTQTGDITKFGFKAFQWVSFLTHQKSAGQ